ncbi:MAG: hypothetical protein AAF567_12850 [Actinomycetota bacterium]
MLRWVPYSAFDHGALVAVDAVAAARSLDEPSLSCRTGLDGFVVSLTDYYERGVLVGLPSSEHFEDPADFGHNFGIELCEVSAWVSWREQAGQAALYRASTDPETVEAAVLADETWSHLIEQRLIGERSYRYWGDGIDLTFTRQSAARPIGEAGTLGLLEDGLYLRGPDERTHTDVVTVGTAAATGPASELGLADAIAVLDSLSPNRILVWRGLVEWNGFSGLTADSDEAICLQSRTLSECDLAPLLEPYAWVVVASSFDDRQVTSLILVHDRPGAGARNAAALETVLSRDRWVRSFELEDIASSDLLTIATLRSLDSSHSAFWHVQDAITYGWNLLSAQGGP